MNKPVIHGFRPNHCLNSVLIEGRLIGALESLGPKVEGFRIQSISPKEVQGRNTLCSVDDFYVEASGLMASLIVDIFHGPGGKYVRVIGKLSNSNEGEVVIIAEHIEALVPKKEQS